MCLACYLCFKHVFVKYIISNIFYNLYYVRIYIIRIVLHHGRTCDPTRKITSSVLLVKDSQGTLMWVEPMK